MMFLEFALVDAASSVASTFYELDSAAVPDVFLSE
jgi:hypothetical protein